MGHRDTPGCRPFRRPKISKTPSSRSLWSNSNLPRPTGRGRDLHGKISSGEGIGSHFPRNHKKPTQMFGTKNKHQKRHIQKKLTICEFDLLLLDLIFAFPKTNWNTWNSPTVGTPPKVARCLKIQRDVFFQLKRIREDGLQIFQNGARFFKLKIQFQPRKPWICDGYLC